VPTRDAFFGVMHTATVGLAHDFFIASSAVTTEWCSVFAEHIKPPIKTIRLFRCIVKYGGLMIKDFDSLLEESEVIT